MGDSITKIKYSVAMMANPVKPEQAPKAYASLQLNGTVSLAQLARHIKEHGSVYGRDTIIGVVTAVVDCTKEYIRQGYAVNLGDLGVFKPKIQSEGAKDLESFTADNIVGLKVGYRMSSEFQDMRINAEFEKVPTRKAVAVTMAAQLAGQTSADWTEPEEESAGGGGE